LSCSSVGTTEVIKLNDDRGGNIGHDAEREDRHALDGATRKHVEETENAACLALEGLGEGVRVDARQRDVGSQAIDEKCAKGKPDPFLEVFRLGESRKSSDWKRVVRLQMPLRSPRGPSGA
jgi:hypothetical protein